MGRNKWREDIPRVCLTVTLGGLGGLALYLGKESGGISGGQPLLLMVLEGIIAALLLVESSRVAATKKLSGVVVLALIGGLSGPSVVETAKNLRNAPQEHEQPTPPGPPVASPTQRDAKERETEEDRETNLPNLTPEDPAAKPGSTEDNTEQEKTSQSGEAVLQDTVDPGPSESREAEPTTETPEAREAISPDSVESESLEKGGEKTVTRVLGYDDYQKFNDEYESLKKNRESLEKKRAEYERRARELESRLRLSQIAYMNCTSGRWQVFYKAHLDDAEKSRQRLEEKNEQLIKLNTELRRRNVRFESERREIERKHIIKGEEYKDEMRNWMDRVSVEYFFALENRLFQGYEEYQNGIDLYVIGINGAAEACRKGDFTSRFMETFISFVRELR